MDRTLEPLTLPSGPAEPLPGPRPRPLVDIVIPVYNEEADLEPSVRRLRRYLDTRFPFPARITIADNASTDGTLAIARRLADELHDVDALHLDQKGRGRALRTAWTITDARVVAYMDVDLSTDLDALLPLVAPLLSGHSDVAIGSRLSAGSRVRRGPKRELISRCYNLILRTALRLRVRDAQCGFKAMRADVARRLLPLVEDQAWFFDTELLVLAQRTGLRVHEVPVDWVDDPDSRVDIVKTATDDLKGVARLMRAGLRGPHLPAFDDLRPPVERDDTLRRIASFAVIGLVSTAAYAGLYLLLRGGLSPVNANAVALVTTAVGNTAANRRFTFGISGRPTLLRDHAAGLLAFAIGFALTSGAVMVLGVLAPHSGRAVELGVLIAASVAATVVRYLLLSRWLAAPDPSGTDSGTSVTMERSTR
ncbi:MAG: bifunctional glycosyltransferase family 2/GtrA family protein [Chloroflexota bacterium]